MGEGGREGGKLGQGNMGDGGSLGHLGGAGARGVGCVGLRLCPPGAKVHPSVAQLRHTDWMVHVHADMLHLRAPGPKGHVAAANAL